jgi:hypothetical protein
MAPVNEPMRKTPASKPNLPDFIPNLQKVLPLYIVLIRSSVICAGNSTRQTVVFRHIAAREQYNRKPHKVVKDYLALAASLVI